MQRRRARRGCGGPRCGGRGGASKRSAALRLEYTSDESCPGGFAACDRIALEKDGDHVVVRFGDPGDRTYETRAWSSRGVVLFSVDGLDPDCDDPGCGNLMHISGVIYPVKSGSRYVPQVKATFVADFPYPEDDDSPDGEVKTVIRMKKR